MSNSRAGISDTEDKEAQIAEAALKDGGFAKEVHAAKNGTINLKVDSGHCVLLVCSSVPPFVDVSGSRADSIMAIWRRSNGTFAFAGFWTANGDSDRNAELQSVLRRLPVGGTSGISFKWL